VACRKCSAEFDVRVPREGGSIKAACPRCGKQHHFRFRPKVVDQPTDGGSDPSSENKFWYLAASASDDEPDILGPLTIDGLTSMIERGRIERDQRLKQGNGPWREAYSYEELRPFFSSGPDLHGNGVYSNERESSVEVNDGRGQSYGDVERWPQDQGQKTANQAEIDPDLDASIKWFVCTGAPEAPSAAVLGPFTEDQVGEMILKGELKTYHHLRVGACDWVSADEVPIFQSRFDQARKGRDRAGMEQLLQDEEEQWYVMNQGVAVGPFTADDIQRDIASRKLDGNDQVMTGNRPWQKLCDCEEFKDLCPVCPPPAPPPPPEPVEAADNGLGSTGLYRVLDVRSDASFEQIKRAYYRSVRDHPPETDAEGFRIVRHAYEILSNPKTRTHYDGIRKYGERVSELSAEAESHMEAKEYDKAERALKEILVLIPTEEFSQNRLGLCLMYQERLDEAIHVFSKLTNQESDVAVYWSNLGACWQEKAERTNSESHKKSMMESAKKMFLHAAELEPHNPSIGIELARLYSVENDYETALAWADKAAQADGEVDFLDFEALFQKCVIFMRSGQLGKLQTEAQRILGLAHSEEAKRFAAVRFAALAAVFLEGKAFEPAAALSKAALLFDSNDAEIKRLHEYANLVHQASQEWARMERDSLLPKPLFAIAGVFLSDASGQDFKDRDAVLEGAWQSLGYLPTELVLISATRVRDYYPNLYKLRPEFYDDLIKAARKRAPETSKGTCFIATAAYGSPDEPVIEVFRGYRDSVLRQRVWGKLIIALYNVVGPYAARVVARSERLRRIVRWCLARIARMISITQSVARAGELGRCGPIRGLRGRLPGSNRHVTQLRAFFHSEQ
jgi:curved DNA-binding protein CbpA